MFTISEGTGTPEGDIVYPEDADDEKRKEFVVEKFKSYFDKYNELCGSTIKDKLLLNLTGCNFIPGAYKVKAVVTFEKEKR